MKTLIYDCEIIRCIPDNRNGKLWSTTRNINGDRIDLDYCEGWHDHKNMGISLIGAYSNWDNSIRLFPQGTFNKFQQLVNQAELIVEFNSISFDDKLCQANGIDIKTDYDLLREVWAAAGMPRKYTYGVTRAGYKLDNLAYANLGKGKSGSGELAPVLWQKGYQWSVADYLVDDILITKQIFEKRNNLIDPTDPEVRLKLMEPLN